MVLTGSSDGRAGHSWKVCTPEPLFLSSTYTDDLCCQAMCRPQSRASILLYMGDIRPKPTKEGSNDSKDVKRGRQRRVCRTLALRLKTTSSSVASAITAQAPMSIRQTWPPRPTCHTPLWKVGGGEAPRNAGEPAKIKPKSRMPS